MSIFYMIGLDLVNLVYRVKISCKPKK